eukprot:TRINITY_DN97_c0_g1_i6.p1 TRINITY_DN97_c0_g1~~TRINITY_DN97_c0_g1_i6.p1  ORF type:complete len:654 (-),score=252.68 TRINITY_DN97_c0_g1_i6:56-2017(-)
MPSISYEKYAKIAGIDTAKTSEKEQKKAFDQMKDQSFSDFFGQYGSEGLNHFTVVELKEELTAQGLETKGVKADLISRLEQHYGKESSHKRKSPERDAGDKKHQKTDSSMEVEVDTTGKNPGNVAGGYKATLHNPNSSEEAKDHARKALAALGEDETPKADQDKDFDLKESLQGKHKGNVIGGYKATLHNPNSSEEAKEHARKILKKLGVDPEEKEAEKESDQTVDGHEKNPGNVIGGLKATAHNPNLSDETRKEAEKKLKEMGVDADEKAEKPSTLSAEDAKDIDLTYKHKGNVIGGYRATLHNPNSSEEAKDHARKILKEMGVDPEGHADSQHQYASKEELAQDALGKNPGNVIGGYRATLHNPNSSEEAKEHAEELLQEMGVDPEGHADPKKSQSYAKHASTAGKNKGNVIGGYRATLNNDKTSEEAKDHARKMLKELGAHESDHSTDADMEGKNLGNVIGGYKATLHNDNSSEEAKDHARKVLAELGADEESDSRKTYHEADTEGKNTGNVIGGYKATLHNDNSSEEAKDHARKVLAELGADEESDSRKTYHEADTEGKNTGNVIGGYKATLKNPNVSDEAKENAKEQLEKLGADEDKSSKKSSSSKTVDTEGKNTNNVIGGYKATLKNPNVSEEAKDHAKEVLENMSA